MILATITLIGLSIVLAFLIGAISGLAWDDVSHVAWLHQYQALVAGVLAVGGAVLTVMVMMVVDLRQHRRHQQLMGLGLRPDDLIIQRAAAAVVHELEEWADRTKVSVGELRSKLQEETDPPQWAYVIDFAKQADRLSRIMIHPDLKDAEHLFSPDATALTRKLKLKGSIGAPLIAAHNAAEGLYRTRKGPGSFLSEGSFQDEFRRTRVPELVEKDVRSVLSGVDMLLTDARRLAQSIAGLANAYRRFSITV